MKLEADATLPFPRERVFAAYRDELPELVVHLPNVTRIEVREREETPEGVRLVNVWHGGGEIPAAARAFLDESMLSWTDHALWDRREWTCSWRIEPSAFREALTCAGKNRFLEVAGGTRLEIRGEIRVDAAKVRGVPRLLAGRVGDTVAEFLAKRIQPNLAGVTVALRRHLER